MDLAGAVALVTGGNGGLGQRICHALAKEGVHVAVMYAQSRDQAESVTRDLTSRYRINAAAFACDIIDGGAVERVVGGVTGHFGRLDILVNDAAYNNAIPFADLDSLTMEVWDKIMAVNLTGPMRLMKTVAYEDGGAGHEGARPRPHRQHLIRSRARAYRFVDRLCGFEGGSDPPDALHGGGLGPRDAGQLRGAGPSRGHACDRQSPARAD